MMYIVLCSLLAIAQEPNLKPEQPTVIEEKKMDVTAEIRVMVPKEPTQTIELVVK